MARAPWGLRCLPSPPPPIAGDGGQGFVEGVPSHSADPSLVVRQNFDLLGLFDVEYDGRGVSGARGQKIGAGRPLEADDVLQVAPQGLEGAPVLPGDRRLGPLRVVGLVSEDVGGSRRFLGIEGPEDDDRIWNRTTVGRFPPHDEGLTSDEALSVKSKANHPCPRTPSSGRWATTSRC